MNGLYDLEGKLEDQLTALKTCRISNRNKEAVGGKQQAAKGAIGCIEANKGE